MRERIENGLIKNGLSTKTYILLLWFSTLFLIIVFARFYYIQFTGRGLYGAAADYNDHLNTAISFMDYLSIYKTGAIEAFKAENRFSYVIAYPVWHISVILFSKVISVFGDYFGEQMVWTLSVVLVNTTFLALSYQIIVRYLRRYTNSLASILIGICLMFCGPFDNFGLFDSYYLGAYTGNIWHNPTYLAVKPLAIACVIVFADIISDSSTSVKKYIEAAVLLAVSAFCKPSFYQCFIPSLVGYCMVHWLIARDSKTFLHFFKVALTCVPVAAVAIFQSTYALSGEGGAGMSIGFLLVIKHFTENWGVSILVSVIFLLFMYVICIATKRWNEKIELSGWILAVAIGMYLILYIDINPFAADFSWAVGLAINSAFVIAAGELLGLLQGNRSSRILGAIGSVLLAAHTFFGIVYFANICETGQYMLELIYPLW